MILQALEECYDIMIEDSQFDVAPFGYSRIMCSFAVVIDEEGNLKGILDLRDGKKGEYHTVPLQAGRAGKNPPPYVLCDKSKYFLGYEYSQKSKDLQAFPSLLKALYELHQDVFKDVEDKGAQAILGFLKKTIDGTHWDIAIEHDIYKGAFIIFKLENELGNIHERPRVKQAWEVYLDKQSGQAGEELIGQCLISGEKNIKLARKHTLTKGVMGAQAAGATLSGVNMDSAESYGKKNAYNAPVAESTMFKYTTALNSLIASQKNRLIIGDTTCVFWTEKEICGNATKVFMSLFGGENLEEEKEIGLSDLETKRTKDVLVRALLGLQITPDMIEREANTKVYILGLSPNMARLSVRFWYEDTFGHFTEKIRMHFEDMDIVKPNKAKTIIGTKDLVKSLAVQGKNENVPKTVENALFTAITQGTSYPQGMYTNMIIRIRAETGDDWCINATRAAFIKAYLKRKYRVNKLYEKEGELTVALNENSSSTAYHLGRLFAVLEKLQQDAGNKGLRERYFASASTNPKVVFPAILKLAQSHIAKVSKNDGGGYMDMLCQDILGKVDEFPASLNLDEQGFFILGYYHQKQYIYTKKENR